MSQKQYNTKRLVPAAQPEHAAAYYDLNGVVARTGLDARTIFGLEDLGAFPRSNFHRETGNSWAATEIDDFARFLDEPSIRDWIIALLGDAAVRP